MGFVTGDNYNAALIPAFMNFDLMFDDKESKLDQELKNIDEINKMDVLARMNQFSCKEEMERYINKAEEHRFSITS